jgi:hypothetical protein
MCCEEKRRSGLFLAISAGSERLGDRQAGDSCPLTLCCFRLFYRLEVATSRRQTKGAARRQLIRDIRASSLLVESPEDSSGAIFVIPFRR